MASKFLSDLLFDNENSDVKLYIKAVHSDKQLNFPAHSLVLKRTSDYFKTVLKEGAFKESQTGIVELKIPGNEVDALNLYRYIYEKGVPYLEPQGYLALLQAGHLYQMTSLVSVCENRLESKLSPSSVCGIAAIVKNIVPDGLYQKCLLLTLRSAFHIFGNNFHLILSEEIMESLLESGYLNVLDEDQVVEAVWNWQKAKACTSSQLENEVTSGSLFNCIRWDVVSNSDQEAPWFQTAKDRKTGTEENVDVEDRNSLLAPSLLPFSHLLDLKIKNDEQYLCTKTELKLVTFSVNRNILISGFALHLSTRSVLLGHTDVLFHITVNGVDVTNMVSFAPEFLGSKDETNGWYLIRVEFRKPMKIESSLINHINIEDPEDETGLKALACFEVKKDNPKTLGDVIFSFHGDIDGLHKIFYFLDD